MREKYKYFRWTNNICNSEFQNVGAGTKQKPGRTTEIQEAIAMKIRNHHTIERKKNGPNRFIHIFTIYEISWEVLLK